MLEKCKQLVKSGLTIFFKKYYYSNYQSFSQAGEDKVIEFLFTSMGISNITYLEIGTNHPVEINNTYLFYLKGSRGVCIEPNPMLIPEIKKFRPLDMCLNVGIAGEKNDILDFYIFDDHDKAKGLSTFSKQEAAHIEATTPIRISKIEKIPVISINEVFSKYFPERSPDFISMDVEGIELEILEGINFHKDRPIAICVETVNYTTNHKKLKRTDIFEFMLGKEYFVYADTGINTIFVDKRLF